MRIRTSDILIAQNIRRSVATAKAKGDDLSPAEVLGVFSSLLSSAAGIMDENLRISTVKHVASTLGAKTK